MSEEIIQSDYEAFDELIRVGSRNTFIEANCERIDTWREFADLGDPRGQVLYGLCFCYGHGVVQFRTLAAQWFEKATAHRNAQAEYSLGECYYSGDGVSKDHKEPIPSLESHVYSH
ncbi:MAG TPA: sel1 repeat family protein [Acidimicrobiia bacterium]|nr:sel1 repeat family protein [Acidimicrobiia bacterium]